MPVPAKSPDNSRPALEDAADLRDLRQATKTNTGKKYHTATEVKRQLAAAKRGK